MIPALDPSALLAKSKHYIQKALAARHRNDFEEFQLWCALALESLGKHVLAQRHPSLIVDASNSNNILVAAGISVQTSAKTISAEETFARLVHFSRRFGGCHDFCTKLAKRRNAELHSGEAAFAGMHLELWEGEYWHAVEAVLEVVDLGLDDWLGTNEAKAPKLSVKLATQAKRQAAEEKVKQATARFKSFKSSRRKELVANATKMDGATIRKKFLRLLDHQWNVKCPACGAEAFVHGDKYQELVSEEQDAEPGWEKVDVEYLAEEFVCPVCDLHLEGDLALRAAKIEEIHVETDEREIEYEPEYGNC